MKTISIIFVALAMLVSFNQCIAKQITIVKSAGGPIGYHKVEESHSSEYDQHDLLCLGPGSNECEWVTKPKIILNEHDYNLDEIVQNVESQIESGEMDGTYTLSNVLSILWTAEDIYNYELTISTNVE